MQRRHTAGDFVGLAVKPAAQVVQQRGLMLHHGHRLAPGHGRNAANAFANALLTDDLEETGLTRVRQMRTAAELDGGFEGGVFRPLGADQQHAHRVRVFLAEDRAHAGDVLRLSQRRRHRRHGQIAVNLFVDEPLDLGDFFR